ncbi:MAG: NAD(P)/FAD-dependent oxidoreductase, partial [Candidatus Zixiibacteriota bacterium]
GPTGVELAGSVAEIARYTIRKDYKSFDPGSSRIMLVEGLDRFLPSFPPDLSEACKKMLNELGVEVITGTFVTNISGHEVRLLKDKHESVIKTQCVLWGAGIKASPLGKMIVGDHEKVLDQSGRILVNKDLSVPGHPNIFVIGDLANYPYQNGEPLAGLAPVAMQQGRYVAKLIVARLKNETIEPFKYVDKGTLATIGRSRAVGTIWKFKFKGFIAWFLWLTIHLRYITGHQNRILVLIQWAWNYFTWARSARVITNVYEHAQADYTTDR